MRGFLFVTGLLVTAVVAGAVMLSDGDTRQDVSADVVLMPAIKVDLSDYQRADGPYNWDFPADYGAHPAFQTEWWYYTGNLATDAGRRFGYQFTIFRRTITPDVPVSESEWRTSQVYAAHFTVTDVEGDQFYQEQRFSRGGAGLAGATGDPYRVWLESWQVRGMDGDPTQSVLTAANDQVAVDLTLVQSKPLVLQGDEGLGLKGPGPGEATYYYSLPHLVTQGTVTVDGETYTVSGMSWMDHEFGSGALGDESQGWDWIAMHFDDGRDLMIGQIRSVNEGDAPVIYGGSLVLPDGSVRHLRLDDFTITVTDTWTSPHTGATYPAGWVISVNSGEEQPLQLRLTPLVADQELTEGLVIYWEGAVRVDGDATGYGYAELTGYHGAMQGRF